MKFVFSLIISVYLFAVTSSFAANVAVVVPKVGAMAKYGNEIAEGAQIAVDMLNDKGGILGEKLNLINVDDRCENSFAISAAQMMSLNSSKNDKISLVIGPYCNNSFYDVANIYANGKIIRMLPLPLSAAEHNTEAKGLIKIGGLMSDEAKAFFGFYKNQMVGKNVAMIYNSRMPQTVETALELQQLFRENNLFSLTLFDFATYNDFSSMAKEILLNNEIAYILGHSEEISVLAQELQQEKAEIIIFVDEYLATEHFFREMGNFVEGVYILALKDLKSSPYFAEDLVELRLKGKEPKGLGVYGYASVKMWAEIIEQTKTTDFDKVVKFYEDKNFTMPWGKISLEEGNVVPSSGYTIYQIKDGEYTQVN